MNNINEIIRNKFIINKLILKFIEFKKEIEIIKNKKTNNHKNLNINKLFKKKLLFPTIFPSSNFNFINMFLRNKILNTFITRNINIFHSPSIS